MSKTDPYKIVVLASGRGSNFEAIAKAIEDNNWNIEISLLVSDKSDAGALEIAKRNNIPYKIVEKGEKKKKAFFSDLKAVVLEASPEIIVLAGFMRLLNPEFISEFRHRIINIHPSLLPSFKGLNAQSQALEAGVHFAGCTVHLVDEDVDSGAILAQAVVPVLSKDKSSDLEKRILKQEHLLLPKVIHMLASGGIEISSSGKVDFTNSREVNIDSNLVSVS